MTTNFLELATTLKYLGAKWLPEKKLILRPAMCFFQYLVHIAVNINLQQQMMNASVIVTYNF